MIQIIKGKIPSKSNSYKIVTIKGHASLAKQAILRAYEKSFYLQCNLYRNKMIKGLFELRLEVYYEFQSTHLHEVRLLPIQMAENQSSARPFLRTLFA